MSGPSKRIQNDTLKFIEEEEEEQAEFQKEKLFVHTVILLNILNVFKLVLKCFE
jgi:hypothetical protein